MAIGMWISCTNVVPNTCALEQQQWNKMTKKQLERRQAQKIDHGRKKWAWNKEILLLFFDASSMIILVNICFFQTYICTLSLMFDKWSMIIVLYFGFYRDKHRAMSLMFNIPSMIFVLHLCLFQTKIPCQYSTYHLWWSFFMFLSCRDKNRVLNVRQMIYDHSSLFCVLQR